MNISGVTLTWERWNIFIILFATIVILVIHNNFYFVQAEFLFRYFYLGVYSAFNIHVTYTLAIKIMRIFTLCFIAARSLYVNNDTIKTEQIIF